MIRSLPRENVCVKANYLLAWPEGSQIAASSPRLRPAPKPLIRNDPNVFRAILPSFCRGSTAWSGLGT
jgi:hypothetical protein